nr:ABC transporter ATP-binding protein [Brachybacterium halotolerans]
MSPRRPGPSRTGSGLTGPGRTPSVPADSDRTETQVGAEDEGASAPAVAVRGLGVSIPSPEKPYGDPIRALRGLTFTAPAGQVTGLVGANGAGKTTALRAIEGAIRATSGRIEVLGIEQGAARTAPPEGLASVPDPHGYPEHWTAHHVARLRRAAIPGFSVRDFGRRLRSFGVPMDRRLQDLSDGQAALFGVSAALAQDPRLLILDEPLARLDPLARERLVDILRDLLARERRSLLLSTHDLDGMDRFIDHLVVMADGVAVLEGSVEDLKDDFLVLGAPAPATQGNDLPGLIGPEEISGTTWALIAAEDAVGLDTETQLHRPELSDLVTYPLRAAASRARTHRTTKEGTA